MKKQLKAGDRVKLVRTPDKDIFGVSAVSVGSVGYIHHTGTYSGTIQGKGKGTPVAYVKFNSSSITLPLVCLEAILPEPTVEEILNNLKGMTDAWYSEIDFIKDCEYDIAKQTGTNQCVMALKEFIEDIEKRL